MEENLKQLLLKDLCARLPYGVKCQIKGGDTNTPRKLIRIEVDELDGVLLDFWTEKPVESLQVYLSEVKPYLRPMSSMTEEERKEVGNLIKENRPDPYGIISNKGIDNLLFSVSITSGVLIDWLNAHHFDYRGLIEKGLALEASDEMYNINNE